MWPSKTLRKSWVTRSECRRSGRCPRRCPRSRGSEPSVRRAGARSSRCRHVGLMFSSSGGRISWLRRFPPGRRRSACLCVPRSRTSRAGAQGIRARGYRLASAVATPAPVVERTRDLVTLDGALGQVAAHVPAVAVEDVELAVKAAQTTSLPPNAWMACGSPSRNCSTGPRQRHPRTTSSRAAVQRTCLSGRGRHRFLRFGGRKQEQVIVLRGRLTVHCPKPHTSQAPARASLLVPGNEPP